MATAPIQPLAWEPPYAAGAAQEIATTTTTKQQQQQKRKHRAYEILPMMLLLGCWGTLLLGPVVSLRYALPLIYCVPRLLEMIVGLTGKR